MSTIRCPKCKLVNMDRADSCRRCGAPLVLDAAWCGDNSRSGKSGQKTLYWIVPAIAIVSLISVFVFYRHSKDIPKSEAGVVQTSTATVRNAAGNPEFEGMRKLSSDFIAQLDRNLADPQGSAPGKNQALALETMTRVRERQNTITDPAAQKFADKFYRQLESYYDQLVQYNSESAHLAEVSQRIRTERDKVLQDPSLTPEEKHAKKFELWDEKVREDQMVSVNAVEIDETVKSLRNLSLSDGSK